MKSNFILFVLVLISTASKAQWMHTFTHTQQAPASHNQTLLDQISDSVGNSYIVYSDDPYKNHFLSKIDVSGNVMWTDTLSFADFPSVDVTKAKLNLGKNKVYVLFPAYGNPGPAAPVVAIYQTNGTYVHHFNASGLSNVWSYGVYGIHEMTNESILVYYSYGDQFTQNDTLYVKRFSAQYNQMWVQKYNVPKLTWHCPIMMHGPLNIYFSYTNDSISGSNHYLNCTTRKLDSNGVFVWKNEQSNVVGRFLKMLSNNKIVLAGNTNPNGSLMGNNTGDVKLYLLESSNGTTFFDTTYNGPNNERDEVYGVEVDPLNNIYLCGAEDIHDYTPFINRGFLIKYNATGQFQSVRKHPIGSSVLGIYLNPLSQMLEASLINGNALKLTRISTLSGNPMDSIIQSITYPIGMAATISNSLSDVFFTYSEGHCGANHLEVLKFCSRAICLPQNLQTHVENSNLHVFPNPCHDDFRIELDKHESIINASLFDIQGNAIPVRIINDVYKLKGLPSGLYFLKIQTSKQSFVTRIEKL